MTDPAHAQPPAAEARRMRSKEQILAQLEKLEAETVSAPVEPEVWWDAETGTVSIREGTPVLWLDDCDGVRVGAVRVVPPKPPPTAPDTASVLARLREKITALIEERWDANRINDAFGARDALALVEAAQQRLDGERGRDA